VEHQDLSGQVLDGRYRVVEPVGKGAMGSVYRAEHLKLRRTVAVKVMNEHVPNEMSLRKRFEREAAAMAKLEHPNCASVLDVGMHGDQPYVVMDFISGRPLDELVREGPQPIARAVEITRQILSGLSHAHEHGIIHRDIKPSNIVLSQKSGVGDHVKILDFGLAKLSQETSNITIGVIVGTPSYMAPEQVRGLALDGRVDVYACGVLLYELLTGVKPFRVSSNDPLAICMAHLSDPIPRLADAMPGRDFGPLDGVLASALAKDRDHRFRTASAFANALTGALATMSPAAAQAAPPARPSAPPGATPFGATMSLADAELEAVRTSASRLAQPSATPFGATVSLADADLVPTPAAAAAAAATATPATGTPAAAATAPGTPAAAVTPFGATVSLSDADLVPARSQAALEPPRPALEPPRPATEPPRPATEPPRPATEPPRPATEPPRPAAESSAAVTQPKQPKQPPSVHAGRRLGLAIAALAVIAAIVIVVVRRGGDDKPAPPTPPTPTPVAGTASGDEPPATPPPPTTPAPPDDAVGQLLARADELIRASQREAAINLLVKARPTYPADARLPYRAGLLYMEKMFRSDGLKQLRAAIERDPSYKTDQKLIEVVVRAFNTTAGYDWALANFLRNDIGAAAKPVLEDVAKNHKNPIVRNRAAAELRRY